MDDKLSKKEFYAKYYPMVKDSVKGTPLHPETVIAQMAIESGWGGSGLTSKYNNFFGVKGKGTPKLLTEEERGGKRESEKASFRSYDSAEDSIKDYVKLLTTDSRYKDVLKAKTPEEQALAIGKTPYSTSSTYGQSILSTVKANKSLAGNKQTTMAKNVNNEEFRLPTEDELSKMTSKEKLKTLDENIYKDKLKAKRDFKSKEDRYNQLIRKSKSNGLTKSEFQEANEIRKEAKAIYDGESEFKKMDADFRNKIAYPYLKDEFKFNELQLRQNIARKKVEVDNSSDENRETLKNELTQLEDNYNTNYGEQSESAQALKELDMDSEKRSKQFPKGASDRDWNDTYDGVGDAPVSTARFLTASSKILGGDYQDVTTENEGSDPYSTTAENLEDVTGDKVGGGSGSSSSSSTTTVDVDDLGSTGGVPADVDDVPATEELDINTQIANKQTELDALEPYNQQAFDDTYAPDFQNDSDLLGTVMDAGRGIMGMIGANEEIPEYSRGAMFSQAMGDAAQMRNEGLSADELAYRERQGEEAFGYDVKNIRRLAGGSGGVALANLGRATGQLYDNKSRTAAEDEGARRMNRQNFQQMALQDENINRRIFEDDLRQAEMTKQAGSQLIQDALGNIKEREDYNKQFGKGSVYYEYNKEKTLDTRSSRIDRENANQRRVSMLKKQTTDDLNKLIKQRDEKQSITADSTFDTVENIRGGGTISKRSSDLDTNPYGGSEVTDDLIKLSKDREEQKRLSAESEADALISGGKSKSLFRRRKNKK